MTCYAPAGSQIRGGRMDDKQLAARDMLQKVAESREGRYAVGPHAVESRRKPQKVKLYNINY